MLEITRPTHNSEEPGKLLVFSFFLHTLDYLAHKLQEGGFRIGVVTGKVEEEDREHLRSRFRKPSTESDAIDILLSSEVGCEGLDYEFCDRMVNYDIPWNPMRLEQRIGRIDRFGQNADKVLIFNFVTPGTVEERIFFRCFERLGIFRDTICPVCAAKYRHANSTRPEEIKHRVLAAQITEVPVILTQEEKNIWLTKVHLQDLQTALQEV